MSQRISISRKQKDGRTHQGFTLMEMLLVASLLAMIGLAVFNTMANGLKIWNKSQEAFVDEDIAIFMDKITHDLHNVLHFSYLEFEGKPEKIRIPTIVYALPDRGSAFAKEESINQIGVAEYSFDVVKHSVGRRQSIYGQALQKQFGPQRELIHSVESLRFKYVYANSEGKWQEQSEINAVPLAVEVDLEIKEKGGIKRVSRHINIPVGT